ELILGLRPSLNCLSPVNCSLEVRRRFTTLLKGWLNVKMRARLRQVGETGVTILREPTSMTTILPYLLHPLRSNWDMGLQWWNPRAIRYLGDSLPEKSRVFEWGSGGSTIWLAERCLAVTAIESE